MLRTSAIQSVFFFCFAGVRGRGEKGAGKIAVKGKHSIQHTEDSAADHDFLGCMSRSDSLMGNSA